MDRAQQGRLTAVALLAFASGLPIVLVSSTLQAWLTVSGVSIVTIGWFSLVGQPYIYKFLWAPLLDYFIPPFLDRRRAWILMMQIALIATLIIMATMHPAKHPLYLAWIACLVAVFSATQDIAYDAYRADLFAPKERGLASSVYVIGYRVALITGGAFALILANYWGWQTTYLLMAALLLLGVIGTFLAPSLKKISSPQSIQQAFIQPVKDLINRRYIIGLLLLIVLYKLGDAFTLSLNTTFLLRDLHFDLVDLAMVNKFGSMIAVLAGSFLGGYFMLRVSLFRALMIFGLLQPIPNLLYIVLSLVGKNYLLMCLTVLSENFFSGMGTVAFMALLMALCNQRFTAAQYALFSAIASIGRIFVGPIAGLMVAHCGWVVFYIFALITAFPGLIILYYLRNKVDFNLTAINR